MLDWAFGCDGEIGGRRYGTCHFIGLYILLSWRFV